MTSQHPTAPIATPPIKIRTSIIVWRFTKYRSFGSHCQRRNEQTSGESGCVHSQLIRQFARFAEKLPTISAQSGKGGSIASGVFRFASRVADENIADPVWKLS